MQDLCATRRRQQQWIMLIYSHAEHNKEGKEGINKVCSSREGKEKNTETD